MVHGSRALSITLVCKFFEIRDVASHVQGLILHGRRVQTFRTYHNIANGGHLGIHTLLLSLECFIDLERKLPDYLCVQLDGGPENVATCMCVQCASY